MPGEEQPRNVGAMWVKTHTESNYVWFLDSDCIPVENALEAYDYAFTLAPFDRILIGPYGWMPKGKRELDYEIKDNYRQPLFDEYGPEVTFEDNLGVALANFSGNLVWPLDEFLRVGGFWNEIHHGRCEDGELGIRAAAMGVPMAIVRDAKACHLWHEGCNPASGAPSATSHKLKANERDVPMINNRHPYVQEQGLVVSDRDGKRFDQICPRCGEHINSVLYWNHKKDCRIEYQNHRKWDE